MNHRKRLVILGGNGHFGRRIANRLASDPHLDLIVTSRSVARAELVVAELPTTSARAEALDQDSRDFEDRLEQLSPDIVLHTAGPYQTQDYRVAEACIRIGSHYIDLADGRDFVTNFCVLDPDATAAGVLAVTGASTLPGVSSAVVAQLADRFRSIKSLEISIAPAHQTPRGLSTVSAVLSYCGKPFSVFIDGAWKTQYGWQGLRLQRYPGLGTRLSAQCDVPDLALLPEHIPGVRTVTFHAALAAPWEHLALWIMAWIRRAGLVDDWSRSAPALQRVSQALRFLGSQTGGMRIRLTGIGIDGAPTTAAWRLTARQNHGPEVPCLPASILARKLARDSLGERGARPCAGLITLDELAAEARGLALSWETFVEPSA